MRCHYCGHAEGIKKTCAQCRGEYLEQIGLGTQRVETELQATFPKVRVGRIDRDTVRRRGTLSSLLKKFGQGELDVLVGTQMIAKGHDFPNVTLVGVVSADVGLGVPDFRAAERTFQLLTQVAGRAGRGGRPGETIVQTLHPDHYSLYHACQQNYKSFYTEELTFRKRMRYPPTVALANMVIKHRSAGSALKAASRFVTALRERNSSLEVLGPAPAPLERLKGDYRVQVLVKGSHRREMREALEGALEICADFQRQIVIDVDPVSVL
jgi:primosomal protein N' (replication factor Y)